MMLSPLYLFVVALGLSFLLGLIDRIGRTVSLVLFYAALLFFALLSGSWLLSLAGGAPAQLVSTAGFPPPFAIALRMGVSEALVTLFANLAALLGALYLGRRLRNGPSTGLVLYLLIVMGVNGMILTRDVFNLFVFIEITSISTYAILGAQRNGASLAAGFKYVMAGGIASTLFLIGVIYIYRISGTLYLDQLVGEPGLFAGGVGFIAFFLLFASILVELKPFPANGWALDVYQASHTGLAALIAAVNSAGFLFAFYKLLPILPESALPVMVGLGLFTFLFANLIGLRHTDARRILGFSSVAQVGLVMAAAAFGRMAGFADVTMLVVVGGLFLNHLLAKAGLFWAAGIIGPPSEPGATRLPAPFIAAFGVLLLALAGFPPFPGFWAKWQLVVRLVADAHWSWLIMLLAGSLFEAIYLLRWFGSVLVRSRDEAPQSAPAGSGAALVGAGAGVGTQFRSSSVAEWASATATAVTASRPLSPEPTDHSMLDDAESGGNLGKCSALVLGALLLAATGVVMTLLSGEFALLQMLPLAAGVALFILDFLPGRIKGVLSLAIIAVVAALVVPTLSGIRWYFDLVFLAGGGVILIGSLFRKGRQVGYFPLVSILLLSLSSLTTAHTALDFLFAWELMAVSSYLLILRGDRTGKASLRYAAFSVGGAFLLMAGFAVAGAALPGISTLVETGGAALSWFTAQIAGFSAAGLTAGLSIEGLLSLPAAAIAALSPAAMSLLIAAMILLAIGFLMKAGAIGVHVWLPGAYGEAEDDTSALISSVMSKAAVFAIMLFVGVLGVRFLGSGNNVALSIPQIVAWIGILTALFGALMAVFQEDVKYLLAYSSMSQIGYMIAAVGMMTHLGWTAAMFMAVNHLLYKGMLFLSIAGVIYRTGTRSMYRMGGLIKKMPISYIAALIGIISVSGVPPLPGFGGKWLFYTALIEKGWYVMAGIAFFSSTIAFLYLFRFIYTVFLGQLKVRYQKLKEAPLLLLLPQVLLIIGTIAISAFPSLILSPIMKIVGGFFPQTIHWQDYTVISTLGYWNGSLVMLVTIGVFLTPLIWLLLVSRKPQVVKQFNMVYAGERPDRPETTHYAHNFFQPYSRALGFLVRPVVVRFWRAIDEGFHSIAKAFDNIYTGNGQTYALHILLYVIAVYFIMRGSL
ncbi:MAG TPA: proton-conducting transporter membrane subunit [Spirochaetia bacterium]|nr:proton-conducting transporter membrane subunit [Spirochaetia bacterium]